jgi:hypothetical protein
MPAEEFASAGLEPEGIYRLRIKSLQMKERTVQSGDRQGQKYKQLSGRFELLERFGTGPMEYEPSEFINFNVSGKGLERFRKLYIAALGEVPSSDEGTVTLNDLADALVGNESVWTTYYWKRNWKDKDVIEGSLGYDFSQDPSDLKEPRPFAERDSA